MKLAAKKAVVPTEQGTTVPSEDGKTVFPVPLPLWHCGSPCLVTVFRFYTVTRYRGTGVTVLSAMYIFIYIYVNMYIYIYIYIVLYLFIICYDYI